MKVKMLRLFGNGVYALKGETTFTDGPKCKISVVGGGDYLIEHLGKFIRIPAHRVDFAEFIQDINEKKVG